MRYLLVLLVVLGCAKPYVPTLTPEQVVVIELVAATDSLKADSLAAAWLKHDREREGRRRAEGVEVMDAATAAMSVMVVALWFLSSL